MRTFLVLAFIAGVGGLAIYLAQKPTIARGSVIAAELVEHNHARGWKAMQCDDEIPVHTKGAKFHCDLELTDGDRAKLAITFTEDGMFMMDVLSTTQNDHSHVPKKADPWD